MFEICFQKQTEIDSKNNVIVGTFGMSTLCYLVQTFKMLRTGHNKNKITPLITPLVSLITH